MRLGLRISGQRRAAEAVAVARAAEQAGFHEVWLTEDYLERGMFSLAGAIAAATSRVTIGLGVVNPFSRHPAVVAMEAATLDELAGGRVVLALGSSNERWMHDWLGIEFTRPLTTLREARAVIAELLTGDPVRFDGERFAVHAQLAFQPASSVPLWYGVKGAKALDAAAREAHGILLSVLAGPAYIRWVRERVGPDVQLGAFVEVSVDDDRGTARNAIRPFVARFLGMHGDQPITRIAGLGAEVAQRFRDALLAGRPDAEAVTDELLDTFVVAGDFGDAADGLSRYVDAGLDTFVVGDRPELAAEHVVASALAVWSAAGLVRS